MHRTVLAIAAVVVVLTGTVVGFVVYRHVGAMNRDTKPPTVASNTSDTPVETPEERPQPRPPVASANTPAPPAEVPPEEMAPEPAPTDPDPPDEASDDVKKRIGDLLATLSQDEKNEVLRQISQERRDKYREEYRYRLRTQAVVENLKWQRDEILRLTDLQSQQINGIIEPMRPRMKDSLAVLWTREGELRQEIAQLFRQGRREEIGPLNDELRDVLKETEEIKNQYNEELKLQLQDILTPEQLDWLKKRDNVGRSPQRPEVRR
ncbi:MAG: hypothetical protein JXL80_12680 [Planctomycetes bacterium]|nr:hypothetical protein [Planctomycetota bacterium]